ncbi:DUF3006 domain-containing protein [Virgibacillus salarius]|uniref:DUF3006 domain-containing protein n=1 Tax=Virgibacillus salarius TaxID=447199 RepID=UPI002490CD40|nr:DUF3006 domain-containing protein [Virgibacillus salarius]WBX82113.1 DUF3006 domain-containing protein [Virgibacillus salarius]
MKGVLDRFEDNEKAVILVEDKQKEILIDKNLLPKGSEVDTCFDITAKDGKYQLEIDKECTKHQAEKISERLGKLRQQRSDSKFRKK